MNKECTKYKTKWINAIIPSFTEFRILCESYDKTELVIITLIRIIIYMIIYKYLFLMDKKSKIMIPFMIIGICIIVVNIISLLYIIWTKQLYKKEIKIVSIEKKEFVPRSWYNSLLSEKREIG